MFFSPRVFRLSLSVAILVAALTFHAKSAAAGQTPGTFTSTANMTLVRGAPTATRLVNGKILIAGGVVSSTNGYVGTASAELYDPAAGAFAATGSMKFARQGHTATLLRDGRVLISGGAAQLATNTDPSQLSNAPAEIYDPSSGTFSTTGVPPDTDFYGVAALLADGRVLIGSGDTFEGGSDVPSGCCYLYDPTSGTFSGGNFSVSGSCTDANASSAGAPSGPGSAITVLNSGQVLITGGDNSFDGAGGSLNCAEVIDPATNSIHVLTMTAFRTAQSSTRMRDGRVLIAGGYDNDNVGAGSLNWHGSAEIFDPRTMTFTVTGAMTDSRYGQGAVLLPNGQVLVAGGSNAGLGYPRGASGDALPYCELYNPASGTFSQTGSMHIGRYGMAAPLLPNALTLMAGGFNGSDKPLISAELYAPPGAVNIGAPISGDTVSGGVMIGTEISTGVSWINIYVDGNYLASGPPFTLTWNSTSVGNGPHVISAKAFNSSSQVIGISLVNVNVGNGQVAMLWPPTGSTVSHKVALADQTGSEVSWVNFYIDGSYHSSGPPMTQYWDSSTASNGQHNLSTRAYNSSGQLIGSDSVTVTVNN